MLDREGTQIEFNVTVFFFVAASYVGYRYTQSTNTGLQFAAFKIAQFTRVPKLIENPIIGLKKQLGRLNKSPGKSGIETCRKICQAAVLYIIDEEGTFFFLNYPDCHFFLQSN